jgi:hypothetical protein
MKINLANRIKQAVYKPPKKKGAKEEEGGVSGSIRKLDGDIGLVVAAFKKLGSDDEEKDGEEKDKDG